MARRMQVLIAIWFMILFCVITLAQEPAVNIDPHRHPNLAEAQRLMAKANQAIMVAQHDNRYDMHGHATRARQLLAEASQELKAAAEEANRGGR